MSEIPDEQAKRVREIMAKPYLRAVQPDDAAWFGQIIEFPGCFSAGDTAEEAIRNLDGVMESWLLSTIAQGQTIPEPLEDGEWRLARNILHAFGRSARGRSILSQ